MPLIAAGLFHLLKARHPASVVYSGPSVSHFSSLRAACQSVCLSSTSNQPYLNSPETTSTQVEL